ncbi:hypothetical protein DYB32_000899 [Aphanomyces invadans]|nr:hypothetical protein DYB32_000899 [Aphanomyces invadans]
MDHPDVAAGIEAEIRQTLLARRDDVADDGDVVDAEEDRTDQVALDEEQIDPKDGLLDDRPMDATLDGTLEKA